MAYAHIVQTLGYDRIASSEELLDLTATEGQSLKECGDYLGAGEWLASLLFYDKSENTERAFSNMIALWASPADLRALPGTIEDLVKALGEFIPMEVCLAVLAALSVARRAGNDKNLKLNDLAVKLQKEASQLTGETIRRPADQIWAAVNNLDGHRERLLTAVYSFRQTNAIAAKAGSVEVVKVAHELKRWAIAAERPILNDLELLLGPAFRKFCESCERQESLEIVKRAPELKELAERLSSLQTVRKNSVLWNVAVYPCIEHVAELVEQEALRTEIATNPKLQLASAKFKIDLTKCEREMTFSCRLRNVGEGRASCIEAQFQTKDLPIDIRIVEPRERFDIGGSSYQLVTFGIVLKEPLQALSISASWKYTTPSGRIEIDGDHLYIEQQHTQPDWQALINDPPYSIQPIAQKETLYGRGAILERLTLNAASGTSTFLWGPKRVGKTSVLQVFASEIKKQNNYACTVLRMGELAPLHEGQIAHRILSRLLDEIPYKVFDLPLENDFGAGLGTLVPYIERLRKLVPTFRFVVIIDEFDDLNSALYTGERGRLFIKALRSLSEIGLTFFFVGSERMATIYKRHELDLNKWVDLHLDSIESREDCKSLIAHPVAGAIEYQNECVELIMDSCDRNPFYMHLICRDLFNTCLHEQRTYVSESDFQYVLRTLTRTQGVTSFSHFWEDNPEIDEDLKAKQAAENCLVLTCLALLNCRYGTADDLIEVLPRLDLGPSEVISNQDLRTTLNRLQNRGVIVSNAQSKRIMVRPPILGSWLVEYAELHLLPRWKSYCARENQKEPGAEAVPEAFSLYSKALPVSEEDLLEVSQRLDYCGKKKDVSELRLWLKQFDDDVRIELAFLLLKRLAEKGFVSAGAKTVALGKLEESLRTIRLSTGSGGWSHMRGRKDNLCVSFIDSEMKSGGTTAREFAKLVRPGKDGDVASIREWIKTHAGKDSFIVIVDDFAGSGSAALKDLKKTFDRLDGAPGTDYFISEKRIICFFLYSFPEALELLKKQFGQIQFVSANVFGDEVRALEEDAGIFRDTSEIHFTRDFLIQIGRELYPQHPIGFDDMAALVCFHNTIPNNSLPIFWSNGTVNEKQWKPLFPRA